MVLSEGRWTREPRLCAFSQNKQPTKLQFPA